MSGPDADQSQTAAARIPLGWVWFDAIDGRYMMWNADIASPEGSGPTVAVVAVDGRRLNVPRRLLTAHALPAAVVTLRLAVALEEALERSGQALAFHGAKDQAAPPRDLIALHAEADGDAQAVVDRLIARLATPAPEGQPDPFTAADDLLRLMTSLVGFGPAAEPLLARLEGALAPDPAAGRGFDAAEADAVRSCIADAVAQELGARWRAVPLVDLANPPEADGALLAAEPQGTLPDDDVPEADEEAWPELEALPGIEAFPELPVDESDLDDDDDEALLEATTRDDDDLPDDDEDALDGTGDNDDRT